MHFYKKLIRTFVDLPNHTSLLVHTLAGCNLKCLGCHNYDEIIANKPKEYLTENDLVSYIKHNHFFDAVIFSGGEFLLSNIQDIEKLLRDVRSVFDGKIIINTNGFFPRKVEHLLNNELVDGIHIDVKLPYHILDIQEDKEIFKAIIGIVPTENKIKDVLECIDIVVKHNSEYSQARTVKYPILSEEFFCEIEKFINELKIKHNSNVKYYLNEFMY